MKPFDAHSIRAILLDIEGTTTPIDFVSATLFPYALKRLQDFLRRHANDDDVWGDLEALRKLHQIASDEGLNPPTWSSNAPDTELASLIAYIGWLMERDSKCPPLKSLQGKIWQEGYREGALHGAVYCDVPEAIERWSGQGKRVGIFSSGSILAQKLLFSTTSAGDLTRFLGAYFDTSIGAKREAQSYRRIADSLGLKCSEILFISDTREELDASNEAGLCTLLCVRGESSADSSDRYAVIRSLEGVSP